jgi:hypothetical protein
MATDRCRTWRGRFEVRAGYLFIQQPVTTFDGSD